MSKLIVLSAPSGAGKTTLCKKLLEEFDELILSISTTTRAPRGREKNGVEYFFVTKEAFQKKIDSSRFAEWAEVHGNFYGTSKDFIDQAHADGKSLLLDIDVQGAESLRKSYPHQTVTIFIRPPSMEELEKRLRARGTESEDKIQTRLKNAATEMGQMNLFDHVVVNDVIDRAYMELSKIVRKALRGDHTVGQSGNRNRMPGLMKATR